MTADAKACIEAHYQDLLAVQRDAHQSLRAAQRRADTADHKTEVVRARLDRINKEQKRVRRPPAV